LVGAEAGGEPVAARDRRPEGEAAHDHEREAREPERAKRRPLAGPPVEHMLDEDRRRVDAEEHDPLQAHRRRERDRGEGSSLREARRAFERDRRCVRGEQKGRQERVLGHQRPRVEERRHEQHQPGRDNREPRRDEASCPEESRHDRERHHHDVHRLGDPVRRRHGGGPPARRDQKRVDEAVVGRRLAADVERRALGDALGELRVDDLVDHDPGRRDLLGQPEPPHDRNKDNPAEHQPGSAKKAGARRRRLHGWRVRNR